MNMLFKCLICLFMFSVVILSSFKASFAEEVTGKIVDITGTKITVQNDSNIVILVIRTPAAVKVGDYVQAICQPIADICIVEQIQIMK